jgi:hypothetical protein
MSNALTDVIGVGCVAFVGAGLWYGRLNWMATVALLAFALVCFGYIRKFTIADLVSIDTDPE